MAELDTAETPSNVRVLAGLDQSPTAALVARRAGRLARQLRAPWEAVHVATPSGQRVSKAAREALLHGFRLAEELGAQTHTLNGEDPGEEMLLYARAHNVTHIVVGGPSRPAWLDALRGSVLRHLLRGAGDIAVELCPREPAKAGALFAEAVRAPPFGDPAAYVVSAIFVAIAAGIAVPLDRLIGLPNISLVFVLAVILTAVRYGAMAAAFAAVLSALAYDFFLAEPYYSFRIADPTNVWAVFFFLIVGLSVSGVAAHARAQTNIARRQAAESASLQAFARALLEAEREADIAATTAEAVSKLLYARVVVQTQKHNALETIAEFPGPEMLGHDDMAAAIFAYEHRREAGHGTGADGARWLFIPVPGEKGFRGVIGVRPFDDASRLDPEQRRLLDLVAIQAGVAFDREHFAREAADARVDAEWQKEQGVSTFRAKRERVDVADVVDTAIERAHQALEGKFVSRDIASGLFAQGDRSLTEGALANALENAGKYSPAHGSVLVRARRDGANTVIEVRDEGPGFSELVLSQVLDEFAHAVKGDGRPSETGLGLSVAKGFLEAQGGTLEVGNRPDRSGAVVRVTLPGA